MRLGLGCCELNVVVVFRASFVPRQRVTAIARGPKQVTYKENMRGVGLFSLRMRRAFRVQYGNILHVPEGQFQRPWN